MRSAETSGVDATGFGMRPRAAAPNAAKARKNLTPIGDAIKAIPPVSLAIAGTALLAALLYAVVDTTRTLNETRSHLTSIGLAVMADGDTASPMAAGQRALVRLARFDADIAASFAGPDGEPFLANMAARIPEGTAFIRAEVTLDSVGTLTLGRDRDAVLSEVWPRIGIALAAALTLGAAGLLRRRKRDPEAATRPIADLIANIPFGVACWTNDGQMLVCNDQYRTRIGLESTASQTGQFYNAAVRRLAQGGYVRLIAENDANRTLELHREDGSCLLIDERQLPQGGFVTLVSDVTERKRTDLLLTSIQEEQRQLARRYHEEKLKAEAASRSKTSFLAHLSHDVRTPLNHIIGFADLIRHQTYGPLGDARYIGYVDTIKNSGERLLASFATILELAELESGQKVLRQEPVRIDDLLISVTQRFSAQAERAGLSLALGSPCGVTVSGDRLGFERMLTNLIENSVRFTPTGGKVTLAAFAGSDGVVIEVSDTGIGMTQERLAMLSQPFSFGDAAFAKEHEGAGLGIAIARAIVEICGGRLAIDSAPALGTTVAISLPAMPVAQKVIVSRAA